MVKTREAAGHHHRDEGVLHYRNIPKLRLKAQWSVIQSSSYSEYPWLRWLRSGILIWRRLVVRSTARARLRLKIRWFRLFESLRTQDVKYLDVFERLFFIELLEMVKPNWFSRVYYCRLVIVLVTVHTVDYCRWFRESISVRLAGLTYNFSHPVGGLQVLFFDSN